MNAPDELKRPGRARLYQNPRRMRGLMLAGLLTLFLLAGSSANSQSRAGAGEAPMAIKGKLIFRDNFATPTSYTKQLQPVSRDWGVRTAHADWAHTPEGVQSRWKSGHMPVLVFEGTFRDAVVEVDFRYHHEPGKWGGCRISATNQKLNPRAYAASVWAKTDSKERPGGMVLEHDEWSPGVITNVDYKKAEFKPDTWYTLRLELLGDKAQATCNGVTVYGTHEKFGLLPKTSLWLGVGTSTHELRNVRVYEATPNPQWKAPASSPIAMPAKQASSQPKSKNNSLATSATGGVPRQQAPQKETITSASKTDDLTAGWTPAPVKFDIQKAWDLDVSERYRSFDRREITDLAALAKRLEAKTDPVSAYIAERLDENGKKALAAALTGQKDSRQVIAPLVKNINALAAPGVSLYDEARFKGVPLREKTQALLASKPTGADLARLNRMLLEDAFPKELIRSPESAWVADSGVLKSTGTGRGIIYTDKNYSRYRLVFQVRQSSGDHFPGVLLFCQRPEPGQPGLDALGGIQFAVPNGGHWDYRPEINKSGTHFIRPLRINFNLKEWAQVEILADATTGTAKMAVAQPVGTTALEVLSFNDPAIAKSGPIALQMHNALLFDEYKDIRIEVDPKENRLITAY